MRLTIAETIALANGLGLTAFIHRGFYSKFIRIRDVGPIDVRRNTISRNSFYKLLNKKGEISFVSKKP